MRLVIISDTHLCEPELPDGDVLIHCGDILSSGQGYELTLQAHYWMEELGEQFKYFLFVPGNHDICFEKDIKWCGLHLRHANVDILIDKEIVIDGVKFYGSPWQPDFFDWAFNLPRGDALKAKWDLIPPDTDVLITHGPPHSILDYSIHDKVNVGCEDLYKRVMDLRPKLHCFGHIHGSYGRTEYVGDVHTVFVNASICDEEYNPVNAPIVEDI